jgi:segregation and condensation protein A
MDQPLKHPAARDAQNLDSGAASDEPAGGYRIKLEIFEGPLDLLLYLIKKEEVSILDIPIARITEQYLDYLAAMQELDIGVAGEFLLMAATLIQIKSQMLLPRDPTVEEEAQEDPRKDLVQQLIEHQKFRAAADLLYQRRVIEGEAFSRAGIESDDRNPEISATIFKLFEVFREILARQQAMAQIEIARDETTLAEKIFQIKTLVRSGKPIRAVELFEKARSRRELVLTFLAILELAKELAIRIAQEHVFGEIVLTARDDVPAYFVDRDESEDGSQNSDKK